MKKENGNDSTLESSEERQRFIRERLWNIIRLISLHIASNYAKERMEEAIRSKSED